MPDIDAPINAVTIYNDRAQITRTGSLTLEAGEHILRINGLPQFQRDSLRASGRGPQGARQMIETQLKAFPDLHIDIEQILASGDHVVVRARLTGTHKGNFAGIAPTNKSVTWRACNIVEVRNGKAIRSRIYADNATLLEQLGVLSLPRAKAAG